MAIDVEYGLGGRRLTPMLRQYLEAKAECPDALLLFRMGDFYELFFEDAKTAAQELDLTLTSRDKGPDPIAMAGVPHHAVAGYITRLVERGYSVAICDQVEDPRLAKGIVKRAITRVITPGTATDLEALDPSAALYVAYVGVSGRQEGAAYVVALLDLLAGEILCTHADTEGLVDELRRMGVRELLVEVELLSTIRAAVGELALAVRGLPAASQPEDAAVRAAFVARFGSEFIEGLPEGGSALDRRAIWRVIAYAEETQRCTLRHLLPPKAYRGSDFMAMDEATRRNLELLATNMDHGRKGSLLWHLDRCRCSMGSRLLRQWLLFPLRHRPAIETRLDAVAALQQTRRWRERVQQALGGVRDMQRLMGRVAVGRAGPRDLAALGASLAAVASLKEVFAAAAVATLSGRWAEVDGVEDLHRLLQRALVDEPPAVLHEGGVFRRGFCSRLDEILELCSDGHEFLEALERRERQRTGIASLKVRYNRVFGYYIEVTKANLAQVPQDFMRKQTLVGAERFITAELKDFEEKVLSAQERRQQRENELFAQLLSEVAQAAGRLRAVVRLVAETDAVASLAQVADEGRYTRPNLLDEPVLHLVQSRHPVLERLGSGQERFVPNDIALDARERQLLIVTGPNMAGKSTVMRQAALCVLLAQMGSFVPAERAQVGLCDRLFTRVGAADNISRGHSTFMVEMVETAAILRHATRSSVVLLDEIGRGTSTYDGVSIAWAVAEHLHDKVGCRTMFATHYHELTDLAAGRPRVVNVSVAVKESAGKVVFLRRLVEGAANRSYGIYVADLAGLPAEVIGRAKDILANLECSAAPRVGGLELSPLAAQVEERGKHSLQPVATASSTAPALAAELARLDPVHMTPVQALVALEKLKLLLAAEAESSASRSVLS